MLLLQPGCQKEGPMLNKTGRSADEMALTCYRKRSNPRFECGGAHNPAPRRHAVSTPFWGTPIAEQVGAVTEKHKPPSRRIQSPRPQHLCANFKVAHGTQTSELFK